MVLLYKHKRLQESKVGSLFVTFFFTYSDSITSVSVLMNFRTQYSGCLVYWLAFGLRIREIPYSNLALEMTVLTEGLYDFTHRSGTRGSIID